jgi:hypothetical protein
MEVLALDLWTQHVHGLLIAIAQQIEKYTRAERAGASQKGSTWDVVACVSVTAADDTP